MNNHVKIVPDETQIKETRMFAILNAHREEPHITGRYFDRFTCCIGEYDLII